MKIRVGILTRNLRAHKPRGVARVARNIAEILATDERFETYAIGQLGFERVDIIASAWPLQGYLRHIPLDLSDVWAQMAITNKHRTLRQRAIDRLAATFVWLLIPPWPSIGLKIARSARIYGPARRIYKFLRDHQKTNDLGDSALAVAEAQIGDEQLISLNNFDVVLGFEAFEDIWDWPLTTIDSRVIGMVHDLIPLRIDEGEGARPDEYLRRLGRMVLQSDRVVCVSASTQRDLLNVFPEVRDHTTVIPNGHDLDRFANPAVGAGKMAPDEHFKIVLIGDVDKRKNLQTVLRALPLLDKKETQKKIEIFIIGNDGNRSQFSSLEAIASKHAKIVWTGYIDDRRIVDLLHSADLFLMPSLWEGFGIPVLEAMSSGIPVVCSELSSFPEIGDECVIYCDPYDPNSIAEAIERVRALSLAERHALISKAKERAAIFTWSRTAALFGDLIIAAASAPKRCNR